MLDRRYESADLSKYTSTGQTHGQTDILLGRQSVQSYDGVYESPAAGRQLLERGAESIDGRDRVVLHGTF